MLGCSYSSKDELLSKYYLRLDLMITDLPEFILASTSSIRKKILDQAGLRYQCVKPLIEEPRGNGFTSPEAYVKLCAQQKAKEVSLLHPSQLVAGCDQTVYFESKILNKAANNEECIQRLMSYSGKSHSLVNGLSFFYNGKEVHYHAETIEVTMRILTLPQVTKYTLEETPLSSVACYYLEAKGIQLIKNINGSFFTALGLPLFALMDFLSEYQKENQK